jgi:DNA-binding MarR family transcriptional regulator
MMQKSTHELIREFNRYYTGILGLLDRHILDSTFSLAEARIMFELSHSTHCTASDLMMSLQMDKGQLSRILETFKKKGLIIRKKNKEDGRSSLLSLTTRGNLEFDKLNKASNEQIKSLVKNLSSEEQNTLISHMIEIKKILSQPI